MDRTFSRLFAAGLLLVVAFGLTAAPARAAGPFQFYSVSPCRVVDTRNPVGPNAGPVLQADQTRTFPIQGLCGVPVGAKAVAFNITAVGPNGSGFLTLFPTGLSQPLVSNINFNATIPAIANGAIVPLADQASHAQDLSVFARVAVTGGTVHLVLDVTGYFQ
jgi:hypothetical protein